MKILSYFLKKICYKLATNLKKIYFDGLQN
jgi:hypothetical protein